MVQNKHGRDKVSLLGIVDIVATDYSNYYLFSTLVAYADTFMLSVHCFNYSIENG